MSAEKFRDKVKKPLQNNTFWQLQLVLISLGQHSTPHIQILAINRNKKRHIHPDAIVRAATTEQLDCLVNTGVNFFDTILDRKLNDAIFFCLLMLISLKLAGRKKKMDEN